jgi:acyl CoA:acetate/3-ketoacid CoA transferase alpha subunit
VTKVVPLEALDGLVGDEDHVGIGGIWLCNHPMAAVRQLVRAGRRHLRVTTMVGSIDIDLLIAAGCLDHLTFSMVSLEAFGLARSMREAIEGGRLSIQETTGLAILVGLDAAGRNVPFLPYKGPHGSDLIALHPDLLRRMRCPFTDEELIGVRAITPDVAIVHASRCDASGNAQWDGSMASDIMLAKAARRVVVTCEQLVSREEIVRRGAATDLPGYYVDAVIEVPFGAHPCSHAPIYSMDAWTMMDYADVPPASEAMERHVGQLRAESEWGYQERLLAGDRMAMLRALSDMGRSALEAA